MELHSYSSDFEDVMNIERSEKYLEFSPNNQAEEDVFVYDKNVFVNPEDQEASSFLEEGIGSKQHQWLVVIESNSLQVNFSSALIDTISEILQVQKKKNVSTLPLGYLFKNYSGQYLNIQVGNNEQYLAHTSTLEVRHNAKDILENGLIYASVVLDG